MRISTLAKARGHQCTLYMYGTKASLIFHLHIFAYITHSPDMTWKMSCVRRCRHCCSCVPTFVVFVILRGTKGCIVGIVKWTSIVFVLWV